MTRRALATIRAFGKLTIVRIGLMAIRALGKGQWLLEVAASMALSAIDGSMLTFKGKFGFGVIKALAHLLQRNLLPAIGAVAGLAALREAAMMRILVAVRTLVEWKADILRLAIRSVGMALCALHLRMQPSQRISRLRVIKLADADRFPVLKVVTGLARRS